jgi:hypothetical protein
MPGILVLKRTSGNKKTARLSDFLVFPSGKNDLFRALSDLKKAASLSASQTNTMIAFTSSEQLA